MIDPENILHKFGYIYSGTCRCDGFYTKKYRKPGTKLIIKWRAHKQLFKVMQGNSTHVAWQNISKLQQQLNELDTQIIKT